jgi:carbonic anhydrase
MSSITELFTKNRRWAETMKQREPDFFARLVGQQAPKYLWIGCADSRVPANEIVGLLPGELFVHRNVANLVVHTDLNCLSVLQFAVDVLQVEHVIVCGHYGCGGVEAAWKQKQLGLIDNWLRHVQDVADRHADRFSTAMTDAQAADRLAEMNVLDQVANVCRTTMVMDAWKRGQPLSVHGIIYRLQDGLLQDLGLSVSRDGVLAEEYRRALAALPPPAR